MPATPLDLDAAIRAACPNFNGLTQNPNGTVTLVWLDQAQQSEKDMGQGIVSSLVSRRPRTPQSVYQDLVALQGQAPAQYQNLVRAVVAVWMTDNPARAKAILAALNITPVAGDEVVN